MTTEIDWSKAPKGATHVGYCPETGFWCWLKNDSYGRWLKKFEVLSPWFVLCDKPEAIIPRPEDAETLKGCK